jgi:hypothetical protein
MNSVVLTKTYAAPAWNLREIRRYAGIRSRTSDPSAVTEDDSELERILRECMTEIEDQLVYKVCYQEFPIHLTDTGVDLGFMTTESKDLRRNLRTCDRIVLFAATVGIELDRRIARYSRLSPVKAVLLQAIGAERIESLCDTFNREVTEAVQREGGRTRPRYSPGYGDLPLTMQKTIFTVLDCPRKIGLSLNESLLMSPSKSVTAILGIDGAGIGEAEPGDERSSL